MPKCARSHLSSIAPLVRRFGPAGDPRAAGIGTPEAIRLVWSTHRYVPYSFWICVPAEGSFLSPTLLVYPATIRALLILSIPANPLQGDHSRLRPCAARPAADPELSSVSGGQLRQTTGGSCSSFGSGQPPHHSIP